MQQGISSVPDKKAQTILQSIKMSARESEIVWEADVPEKVVADFIRTQSTSKKEEPKTSTKRPVRRKRTR
jgi:hypothetical protein